MSGLFLAGVGGVLSADIAVHEHEREQRFYSRVLSTGPPPLWRAEDLMNNLGMPIIGLGARTDDHAGLPLQWMPHIQVRDVATSVQRALEMGGRVAMHAKGAAGQSQWAVLIDPNGAAFGVIPVVPADAISHSGDEGVVAGRIAWMDLTVPDASATRDFYRDVIGWSPQDVAMKDGTERYADYNMLADNGRPVAGVCHARGVNADLPPVWLIYLPVGDIDESLRRAEEQDGAVLRTMKAKDGRTAFAVVRDPAGVHFALVPA